MMMGMILHPRSRRAGDFDPHPKGKAGKTGEPSSIYEKFNRAGELKIEELLW